MNAAEHAESVLTRYCGRLTWEQAVLVACSGSEGTPLDPFGSDDAAVLLRAEQLVEDGTTVRTAIVRAREELRASRHGLPAVERNSDQPSRAQGRTESEVA